MFLSLLIKYSTETEGSNYGAKLTVGALTAIASTGKSTIGTGSSQTDDRNASGIGIKYDMGGGLTIAASATEVEDTADTSAGENEKYTSNIGEVVYTVAPGLKAKVTYTDYEYKDGSVGVGDDSGQITQLTISASF